MWLFSKTIYAHFVILFRTLFAGRRSCDFKLWMFKLISRINILSISCEITSDECHKTSLTTMQIKMGCHTVPPAPVWVRISLNLGSKRSRVPGWWDPGIHTNTGALAHDTVWAKHIQSVLARLVKIVLAPLLCSYWHSVPEGGHECWPVIRSTAHHPLLPQPPLLVHSMTLQQKWD